MRIRAITNNNYTQTNRNKKSLHSNELKNTRIISTQNFKAAPNKNECAKVLGAIVGAAGTLGSIAGTALLDNIYIPIVMLYGFVGTIIGINIGHEIDESIETYKKVSNKTYQTQVSDKTREKLHLSSK